MGDRKFKTVSCQLKRNRYVLQNKKNNFQFKNVFKYGFNNQNVGLK